MVDSFARSRSYLHYAPKAWWLSFFSGILSAFLYVLLIVILALFTDLLISRGRIPIYAELSLREQLIFAQDWEQLTLENRLKALEHLGIANQVKKYSELELSQLPANKKKEYQFYLALLSEDCSLPIVGVSTEEQWQKWLNLYGTGSDDPLQIAFQNELRWRAYVWSKLQTLVSKEAANQFQPKIDHTGEMVRIDYLGTVNHNNYGILSAVVSQRHQLVGRLLGKLASFNPWMWQSTIRNGEVIEDANHTYLTGLLFLAVVTVLVRFLMLVILNLASARTCLEAITRIRRAIYHQTTRLGNLTIRSNQSNESSGLFTHHVEALHEAFYIRLTYHYRNFVQVMLLLLMAFLADFLLAATFTCFAVIIWMIGGQLTIALRRRSQLASRQAANQSLLLLESLRLMRLMKAYLMEFFNQSRVERQLKEYAIAHRKRYDNEGIPQPLFIALGLIGTICLLYIGGKVILADESSVVNLIVLLITFLSLFFPLRNYFDLRKTIKNGQEAATAIFEFLDRKGDLTQIGDAEFLPPMQNSLEFMDVSVREPGTSHLILRHVNLKIESKEQIGIVGTDHQAKMALISLIPRFYDPSSGEIRIDGRNIKWVTQESLRVQMGVVLQNHLIFNDTIANNIGCGDPGFVLPQIIEAAKVAHAHQFIQMLPYGYQTTIGELGYSLTVGQQFRIALARAILRDPAILLIEEPVNSFDEDTKDLLDDTMNRFLPGRTVIYVPHRISTLKHCDRILLLDEGKIVATGTHRELLHQNDLYRHLYYLEFAGNFAEA